MKAKDSFSCQQRHLAGHPAAPLLRAKILPKNPNTFQALVKAIVDATQYAHDEAHRKEIANAIAPRNFEPAGGVARTDFNRRYPDGLGNMKTFPTG
jgi:nitrate/nitrite transport system substrate-binding protein